MNGTILDYSVQTNSGLITGDDGNRYNFVGAEWKDEAIPNRGTRVDFEAQGGDAVAIYRAMAAPSSGGISGTLDGVLGSERTKLVAGLLGIFLGWVGVHKFYLGIKRPAIMQLAVGGGGVVLALVCGQYIHILGDFRHWRLHWLIDVRGWLYCSDGGWCTWAGGRDYLPDQVR